MVYCSSCGKENDDTSKYCAYCGASLQNQTDDDTVQNHMQRFGENMERMGNHLEKKIDHATKKTENWYQKTFHIYGPLISSFLSLIGMYIVIVVISYFSSSYSWLLPVSEFLYSYVLIFFCIILIANYLTYFSKIYTPLRYVIPLLSMIGVFIWFWVISTMLVLIYDGLQKAYLINLAHLLDILVIPIAFLVLFIGYIKVFFLDTKRNNQREKASSQKDHHDQ